MVQTQRGLERGQSRLVDPQRPAGRIATRRRDPPGGSDDDSRLWSTEQLVAREHREIHPGSDRRLCARLRRQSETGRIDEESRADVVHQRDTRSPTDRNQLRDRRFLGEAGHPEVGPVHLQDRRRGRSDGDAPKHLFVVRGPGPIRAAHLDHARRCTLQHVGYPESPSDLYEFAPADHDPLPRGDRVQDQHQRRGAVVHDQSVLGTGQLGEESGTVVVPRASTALGQVEFESAVAGADRVHRAKGLFGERGAAQIRVQHDARRVQHGAQRPHRLGLQPPPCGFPVRVGVGRIVRPLPLGDGRAGALERLSQRFYDPRPRESRQERAGRSVLEESVESGNATARVHQRRRRTSCSRNPDTPPVSGGATATPDVSGTAVVSVAAESGASGGRGSSGSR